jgi:hypothetical protein
MWRGHWSNITKRMNQLVRSAEFLLQTGSSAGSDYHGVSNNYLIPSVREVLADLRTFSSTHGSLLPSKAQNCLTSFLSKMERDFNRDSGYGPSGWSGVQGLITPLLAFASEFDFHLSNSDQIAKSLTERAFLHLQRSIVVDDQIAKKWQEALVRGELACEKLGAIHLLSHGIWAFKVDGAGERTDLILSRKIESETVQKTDTALVLTEWKVAKSNEIASKCMAALEQARRYSQGVLAGVELETTRYLVIVTEKNETLLSDEVIGQVRFSFINIAVNPSSPSKG